MARYIATKDGKVFDIYKYWIPYALKQKPDENYWVNELLREENLKKEDCVFFDDLGNFLYHYIEIDEDNEVHLLNEFEIVYFNDYLETNPRSQVFGVIRVIENNIPILRTVAKYNREERRWELL